MSQLIVWSCRRYKSLYSHKPLKEIYDFSTKVYEDEKQCFICI